jgi:hypothetical protein
MASGRHDPHEPRFEPVAKADGGVRWLTRLDPAGEKAYRDTVRPLAGRIERSLGPEVIASRARQTPDGWRLAPWRRARGAWRQALRTALREEEPDTVFAVADVRDCYGSITPSTIADVLGPEAAHAVSLLRRLRHGGVRGLPVGPEPSAILANAVLARLDEAVRGAGADHLRWVDDFVVWGSRADVAAALLALQRTSSTLGLTLHDRKTRRVDDRDEARAVALGRLDSSIIAAP